MQDRDYDHSIDIWSFACVLAELKRGTPIWPGTDEEEQLKLTTETLGSPSPAILAKAKRSVKMKKEKLKTREEEKIYISSRSNNFEEN